MLVLHRAAACTCPKGVPLLGLSFEVNHRVSRGLDEGFDRRHARTTREFVRPVPGSPVTLSLAQETRGEAWRNRKKAL